MPALEESRSASQCVNRWVPILGSLASSELREQWDPTDVKTSGSKYWMGRRYRNCTTTAYRASQWTEYRQRLDIAEARLRIAIISGCRHGPSWGLSRNGVVKLSRSTIKNAPTI